MTTFARKWPARHAPADQRATQPPAPRRRLIDTAGSQAEAAQQGPASWPARIALATAEIDAAVKEALKPPAERIRSAVEKAAIELDALLSAPKRNPPLEKGVTRKFQKAWNSYHRVAKRDRLPEDGEYGRATNVALRQALKLAVG